MSYRRYTMEQIESRLRLITIHWRPPLDGVVWKPACFCPYFVPLAGALGRTWGVQINPSSSRFANLLLATDECGCPDGEHDRVPDHEDVWRAGTPADKES
jgi:hypothetical protein